MGSIPIAHTLSPLQMIVLSTAVFVSVLPNNTFYFLRKEWENGHNENGFGNY